MQIGNCHEVMTPEELSDRLWKFAARVGKVVDALPDNRLGRHVAGQLVRCGTSSAPNYDEACAAESRADFAHKVSIALKEMRESRGWLKFIVIAELLPDKKIVALVSESEELAKILGKSVVTVKKRPPQETM
ncbi:MAG: four helix bundle protein [Verrucomicrobiota bacterium]